MNNNYFEQLSIFEYLSQKSDPIFQKLKRVDKERSIFLSNYIIRINSLGNYEVESQECHEQFKSFTQCYKFVVESLVEEQLLIDNS